MSDPIDRAADIITDSAMYPSHVNARGIAQALADAGLLVTDEMQALLDAAERRHHHLRVPFPVGGPGDDWIRDQAETTARYHDALDAYLASKEQPPDPNTCPNVYMEGRDMIQVLTPNGWVNVWAEGAP